MKNHFKDIFDPVHADNKLKEDTLQYLQAKMYGRKQRRPLPARRFLYSAASVATVILVAIFSYQLYFTPSAYIDVDVNPSIELTINRFNRVVDTHAYNTDGGDILAEAAIIHRDYRDAVNILFDIIAQKGYSETDSYISVTLSKGDDDKENSMLSNIESTVLQHHAVTNLDTLSVDSHIRDVAHDHNLSPAKYLAIQELISVDSSASIDSCRSHSIEEINELTNVHSEHHHGGSSGAGQVVTEDTVNEHEIPDVEELDTHRHHQERE